MRWVLITAVALVVAASFYADYRWKRWLAAQREERNQARDEFKS